jgi:hypothetical protein
VLSAREEDDEEKESDHVQVLRKARTFRLLSDHEEANY